MDEGVYQSPEVVQNLAHRIIHRENWIKVPKVYYISTVINPEFFYTKGRSEDLNLLIGSPLFKNGFLIGIVMKKAGPIEYNLICNQYSDWIRWNIREDFQIFPHDKNHEDTAVPERDPLGLVYQV